MKLLVKSDFKIRPNTVEFGDSLLLKDYTEKLAAARDTLTHMNIKDIKPLINVANIKYEGSK